MDLLENPARAKEWKATIGAVASMTPLVKQLPWLHGVARCIPKTLLRRFSPDLARIQSLQASMAWEASKAIKTHEDLLDGVKHTSEVQKPAQGPTVFSHLLLSKLPIEEKGHKRLSEEAFSIIAAGGETVARTLTIATYHLLANSTVLEKLRVEIRSSFPTVGDTLRSEDVEKMPWLVCYKSRSPARTVDVSN
ncbi:MAG: hypothetical protein Q9222_002640 [Ikaeria aurantiellina]